MTAIIRVLHKSKGTAITLVSSSLVMALLSSPGTASASEEGQESSEKDDVRLPKEQPPSAFFDTKAFRLISIFLYLGGISGLGMVLALYFLFFFDSTMPDIHLKFPVSIGGHPVQKVHEYQ